MDLATKLKLPISAKVRWRIAVMVVALCSVLYTILAVFGILSFDFNLNSSIDRQLRILGSELGHAIELDSSDKPHFRDWLRVVQTEPERSIVAIQIYDPDSRLIEHYGQTGPSLLVKDRNETKDFRIFISPLWKESKVVGYLQIAYPLRYRNAARHELQTTALLLAPFLLLGLGFISYIVSDLATAPIREYLNLLKQFIADASHELNTPIGILRARTDVLEKKLIRSHQELEDVKIISSATDRMDKIVGDLMLLAELDAAISLQSEDTVRLDEALKRIVSEFEAKFREKEIDLDLKACEAVSVRSSEDTVQKIFSNLIENAWRYTERHGHVSLSVTREQQFAKVDVVDTGIGIPPESIPFIFDRFYRVDKSRSRASGGAGLGLSIVKALIEAHQGHLQVNSKVGEGTVFSVFLPAEIAN